MGEKRPTKRASDVWDASRAARFAVKHFAERGFEFYLLPNIIHARPVPEIFCN
jgi:hypothetical protein